MFLFNKVINKGPYQKMKIDIQARIAQLVAYRLGKGEVQGSNPGKGENY